MTPPARLYAPLLSVLAVALLVSGCGDTVIDQTKAEEATQASLEKSLRKKISAVECPAEQKVEAGETFDCTVRFPGGEQATAQLKILNEDADVRIVGVETNK